MNELTRINHEIKQRTFEWEEIRLGKWTASNFDKVMMKKSTKGYWDNIYRVAYERLTNERPESFQSDYMLRGLELEPLAIEEYETMTFAEVIPAGFIEIPELHCGCSPDGLIGEDGLIEVKAPAFNTMIEYLIDGLLPSEYYWQVQGQLWITERKWLDFFAYHPKLKTLTIRIYPEAEAQEKLFSAIVAAENEVKKIVELLK